MDILPRKGHMHCTFARKIKYSNQTFEATRLPQNSKPDILWGNWGLYIKRKECPVITTTKKIE